MRTNNWHNIVTRQLPCSLKQSIYQFRMVSKQGCSRRKHITRALSTCRAHVCAPSVPNNFISCRRPRLHHILCCPFSPCCSAACHILQCERRAPHHRRQSHVEPSMSQAFTLSVAFWFRFCGSNRATSLMLQGGGRDCTKFETRGDLGRRRSFAEKAAYHR